jgi:hypothetical protein
MERAEKKLREAMFFLPKMRESEGLAVGNEPEEFDYYLSAFLSAARSVTMALDHEYKTFKPAWFPKWLADERNEKEAKLHVFLTADRNREVHRYGSRRDEQSTELHMSSGQVYEHPRGGRTEVLGPPGMARAATLYLPEYYFVIDGAQRKVTDVAQEYVGVLKRLLADFRADHTAGVTPNRSAMGDFNDWLDACGWSGLQLAFRRPHDGLERVHLNLLLVARAQFAVDRSYERLQDAAAIDGIEGTLLQFLDAHAFLVSADLFWRALKDLDAKVDPKAFPPLREALDRNESTRTELTKARNHIVHVTERVREGRDPKRGPPAMSKEVFRQAMGLIDGTKIRFGDESFDLADQLHAVVDVRDSVARELGGTLTPSFTVTTT